MNPDLRDSEDTRAFTTIPNPTRSTRDETVDGRGTGGHRAPISLQSLRTRVSNELRTLEVDKRDKGMKRTSTGFFSIVATLECDRSHVLRLKLSTRKSATFPRCG